MYLGGGLRQALWPVVLPRGVIHPSLSHKRPLSEFSAFGVVRLAAVVISVVPPVSVRARSCVATFYIVLTGRVVSVVNIVYC